MFPCQSKSSTRFRSWVNYCKRKSFNPGNSARICSKHFKSEDQSDLIRQKLMPNIKVKVKLNANAVPMVPQNIPSTSNSSNLSKREKRQRLKEKKQILSSIMISTPKKLKLSFRSFENGEYETSDDDVEDGNLVAITNE